MEKKEVWLGYEIHRLDNAIKKRIDHKLKSEGVDEATVVNGWVLKYLYDNRDTHVYQKDIEKHFNIGRSTVTGILKMMEKQELVCRISVEKDARLKQVILLPKGEEVHRTITKAILDTNKQLVEGVTSWELESVFEILTRIRNNIDSKER